MLKVYGDIYSGNCYKQRLLLTQLGLPHTWVHLDILKQQTRTPEFLAMNPNGRVPLLELPGGVFLAESNAISLEAWKRRPLEMRFKEGFARLWEYWL